MRTSVAANLHHRSRPTFAALLALLPVSAMLLPVACSAAVQECQARVLQPVTDDMGHTWAAGSVVPVDIARSAIDGAEFCAHGGACLPPQMSGGSKHTELTNCRIGKSIGGGDYRLVPDPNLAGKAAAAAMEQRSHAEQKLSALGFSNAAAGTLADEYVNHPESVTAMQVRMALRGSARALKALQAQYP